MFQPYTNGYLITTVETVMMTGKRTPPIWLIILTALATLILLVGGILLLRFYHTGMGPHTAMDTFFGTLALLVVTLSPAFVVIRRYLKLENPITIRREAVLELARDGAHLSLLAQAMNRKRPIRFILGTRSDDEAMTIERNLSVHTNGRLRVYPVTFLPEKQRLLTTLAQTEIHLVAPEKGR